MLETVYQNEYRIVWITNEGEVGKGTFLFSIPEESKETIESCQDAYPEYLFWLEDRECNKVEI